MSAHPILYLGEAERSWLIAIREEGRQRVKYTPWLRSRYHIQRPTADEMALSDVDTNVIPHIASLFIVAILDTGETNAYGTSYLGVLLLSENSLKVDFGKLNAAAAEVLFTRCVNYTGDCHIRCDEKFPRNLPK